MKTLYYYTPPDHLLDNLTRRRLKVSSYLDLNDPFEMAPFDISNPEVRTARKKVMEEWASNVGLICLSETWRSPAMWAHYARNHTGACLAIEVGYDHVFPVEYSAEKLFPDVTMREIPGKLRHAGVTGVFGTKSKDWSYEREHRLHVPLEDTKMQKEDALRFLPFDEDLTLKTIYVGAKCTIGINALNKVVETYPTPVQVVQTRPAFSRFEVVEQNDTSLWHMGPS